MPDENGGSFGKIATIAASIIGVLYALGLIVTNVHLSQFGVSDFDVVRPRFVLVGLAFVVYLLLPAFVFAAGLAGSAAAFLLYSGRQPWLRAIRAVLLFVLGIILALYMLPLPLHYFVVTRRPEYWYQAAIDFWALYNHPLIREHLLHFCPSILGVALSYIGVPRLRSPFVRVALWISLLIASVGQVVPYVVEVFPNVVFALGGGQPSHITLAMSEEAETAVVKATGLQSAPRLPKRLLMWYQTADWILVTTDRPEYRDGARLLVAKSEVKGLWMRPARTHFQHGVPTWTRENEFIW